MILVDSSVWIDHMRKPLSALKHSLHGGGVLTHPLVIGELACGNLRQRQATLKMLRSLPKVAQCSHTEVDTLIESEKLMGRGIGIVDAHLLCAARLNSLSLWTRDRRLNAIAQEFSMAFQEQEG